MTYFEKFYRLRYWILLFYIVFGVIIFICENGWQIADEAKDLFEKIRSKGKRGD